MGCFDGGWDGSVGGGYGGMKFFLFFLLPL